MRSATIFRAIFWPFFELFWQRFSVTKKRTKNHIKLWGRSREPVLNNARKYTSVDNWRKWVFSLPIAFTNTEKSYKVSHESLLIMTQIGNQMTLNLKFARRSIDSSHSVPKKRKKSPSRTAIKKQILARRMKENRS